MNCDRLAPWYRWLEYAAFGRALEHRRNSFLHRAQTARRVLLLGDGDGRFAARLLSARGREATITLTCVDSSPAMLALAGRRLRAWRERGVPIEFVQADARAWLRGRAQLAAAGSVPPFDLIVTHFFLDCFSDAELPALVRSVARVAAPDARWLISEFRQPPGNGLRAWHAAIWLQAMYLFFRWTTGLRVSRLADHRPALAANGFRLSESETGRVGLLVSECWQRGA